MNGLYTLMDTLLPFEWLHYTFMKNALIAIVLLTPLFGMLGTMAVDNKMAFFSDALGHSALTGIAIGVVLGWQSQMSAMLLFGLIWAVLITFVKHHSKMSADTIISVFSSTSIALGLVVLSRGGAFAKYSSVLVGDVLSVAQSDLLALLLALCLISSAACAATFTDAHGNVIELDDSLEAYAAVTLVGADNAARQGETNLGDLWADALRWFAVSGEINAAFDEDDVKAGNDHIAVDADHVVALWNGGNLRADIAEGTFGAEALAEVLPFPNKVAVVYMTGAQLLETLEAASQGLPYTVETADACASLMQVSGLTYTVDTAKAYDALEAYGDHWFTAGSVSRVRIDDVNGQPFDAEATYAVVTSNANFNGMDSSYVLKAAAEANEQSAVTTAVVRDVVWSYIASELNNQIGDAYAAPQGRLTVQ